MFLKPLRLGLPRGPGTAQRIQASGRLSGKCMLGTTAFLPHSLTRERPVLEPSRCQCTVGFSTTPWAGSVHRDTNFVAMASFPQMPTGGKVSVSPATVSASLTTYSLRSVEDHRQGYPQFSAFLSLHPSFYVLRRFTRLRTRHLLEQQDKLSVLEETLGRLDGAEPDSLFLGARRLDNNAERAEVLGEIKVRLQEFGNRSSSVFTKTRADRLQINSWNRCESSWTTRRLFGGMSPA